MRDGYNKMDLNKQKAFLYGKFGKADNGERNYFKVNGSWENLNNCEENALRFVSHVIVINSRCIKNLVLKTL